MALSASDIHTMCSCVVKLLHPPEMSYAERAKVLLQVQSYCAAFYAVL